MLVGWLEFNVPFSAQHGYIRDDCTSCIEIQNDFCGFRSVIGI